MWYTLKFASDNDEIATVTQDGVVTGVCVGTVKIIAATDNGLKTECTVVVTKTEQNEPVKPDNPSKPYEPIVPDKPSTPDKPNNSGGGGGCNASMGALALLAIVPLIIKGKRK